MEIWEMVGLWHYPVPGFFLLAQFCLGILVALGNLVSNSVFLYLSDEDGRSSNDNCTVEERKIALYLSAIGQKFLSMYRSFGTYIAFLTILIMVYQVRPKYVSFGYIFLRLFWITGRQLVEKTKQRLWFPLKAYAVVVFIFIYSLSIFPSFEMWLSGKIDLSNLGYDTEASLLDNVLESLAIMIVMQLYSYERRKNRHFLSMEYQTVLRWLLN